MSGLVTRLRRHVRPPICRVAAAEIERLTAEVERLKAANDADNAIKLIGELSARAERAEKALAEINEIAAAPFNDNPTYSDTFRLTMALAQLKRIATLSASG